MTEKKKITRRRSKEPLEVRRAKQAERERRRRAAHPNYNRATLLKSKFGITLDEYEAKLAAQDGGCAICGGVCETGRRLSVDHDHATGAVRDILCKTCNTGIGLSGDDLTLLAKAKAYLQKDI